MLFGRPVTCFSVVWTLRVVDTARLMIDDHVRAAAERIVMRRHQNFVNHGLPCRTFARIKSGSIMILP